MFLYLENKKKKKSSSSLIKTMKFALSCQQWLQQRYKFTIERLAKLIMNEWTDVREYTT